MSPKVYVLSRGGYEGDSPVSVHLSAEAAMAASPGHAWNRWNEDKWMREATHEERQGEIRHATVEAVELDAAGADAMQQFALAILAGDPVACDAAKDVLKL